MREIERSLESLSAEDATVQRLRTISGVGLMVSTALRTAVSDIHRFRSGRHLSCWMSVTPREHSSGEKRRLGAISKMGGVYLRIQPTHGARAAPLAAKDAAGKGLYLDRLRRRALETEKRVGHNKAVIALANMLVRIMWATWRHGRAFLAIGRDVQRNAVT